MDIPPLCLPLQAGGDIRLADRVGDENIFRLNHTLYPKPTLTLNLELRTLNYSSSSFFENALTRPLR